MQYLLMICCFLTALTCNSTVYAEVDAPAATYTESTTGMQFVYIPSGTFTMGDLTGKDRWATPPHDVTIKPFYMGKFEVTFNEYDLFCSKTGRLLPSDAGWGRGLRPVINVSWHDAVDFAKWLSEETGRTFRLPSEAEWEYAARAGSATRFPWGDSLGRSNANCRNCGSNWDGQSTASIGSFTPNRFGLHDMIGNVQEWCLDTFHRGYKDAPDDGTAWTDDGPDRIYRGGSWADVPKGIYTYTRCWDPATTKDNQIGFRLVMVP